MKARLVRRLTEAGDDMVGSGQVGVAYADVDNVNATGPHRILLAIQFSKQVGRQLL